MLTQLCMNIDYGNICKSPSIFQLYAGGCWQQPLVHHLLDAHSNTVMDHPQLSGDNRLYQGLFQSVTNFPRC